MIPKIDLTDGCGNPNLQAKSALEAYCRLQSHGQLLSFLSSRNFLAMIRPPSDARHRAQPAPSDVDSCESQPCYSPVQVHGAGCAILLRMSGTQSSRHETNP